MKTTDKQKPIEPSVQVKQEPINQPAQAIPSKQGRLAELERRQKASREHFEEGQKCLRDHHYLEAESSFRKAIQEDSTYLEAYQELLGVQNNRLFWHREAYDTAESLTGINYWIGAHKSAALCNLGRYSESLTVIESLLNAKEPPLPDEKRAISLKRKVLVLITLGRIPEAKVAYGKARACGTFPENSWMLEDMFFNAIEKIVDGIDIAASRKDVAYCFLRWRSYEQALRYANQVLLIEPLSHESLEIIARALLGLKQFDKASDMLQKSLSSLVVNQRYWIFYILLGVSLSGMGRGQEALESYAKACHAGQRQYEKEYIVFEIELLVKMRRFQEVIDLKDSQTTLLKIGSKDRCKAAVFIAQAYGALGRYAEAKEEVRYGICRHALSFYTHIFSLSKSTSDLWLKAIIEGACRNYAVESFKETVFKELQANINIFNERCVRSLRTAINQVVRSGRLPAPSAGSFIPEMAKSQEELPADRKRKRTPSPTMFSDAEARCDQQDSLPPGKRQKSFSQGASS